MKKKKNMASEALLEKLMEYGEQSRLARQFGIPSNLVNMWANGRRGVPRWYHKRIQELYGFAATTDEVQQ